MKIKRIAALLLCLAMVFAMVACKKSNNEENLDKLGMIKQAGKLVIATEGDWSPWTYHDPSTGALVGLDVEIGTEIAKRLGVEAEFQETNWDSILAGVEAGRFDIACNGVGYTEKRALSYSFSTPYVYTHKVLVVKDDNTDIKSFEDLKGKKTANTASSTYAAIAEDFGATVTPVDSLTETIELVLTGRVDATINAQVSIEDYLKANPNSGLKIVALTDGDPVAYPMQKTEETETLVAEVNRILDEMRNDGTLSSISLKYFGLDLTKAEN